MCELDWMNSGQDNQRTDRQTEILFVVVRLFQKNVQIKINQAIYFQQEEETTNRETKTETSDSFCQR